MRKMILLAVCAGAFALGWFVHKGVVNSHPAQNEPAGVGDAKVSPTDINGMQDAKSDDSQTRIDAKHDASTLYVWVAGTKEESKHVPGAPKSISDEPININAIQIVKPEDSHISPGGENVMWSSNDAPPAAVFGATKKK